jgi:hypothetical protein
MKLIRSKQWFEDRIAIEGDCEIGAGNLHFGKKLTWADKVRKAIETHPDLKERIKTFNYWKILIKEQPKKYRICYLFDAQSHKKNFSFQQKFQGGWLSIEPDYDINTIEDYF